MRKTGTHSATVMDREIVIGRTPAGGIAAIVRRGAVNAIEDVTGTATDREIAMPSAHAATRDPTPDAAHKAMSRGSLGAASARIARIV